MTTNKITESAIEELAIELLEKQGYRYIYAPDIAPDCETPERDSFEDVLLLERLRRAVGRINPTIPADAREDAIKQIQRLNSPELIANNEAFHRMLTEGIKVSYQKDGADRGDIVWLVDFNNPENNEFLVIPLRMNNLELHMTATEVTENTEGGFIVKNQTIQTIFADFALFAVTKIMHRKERKVFRIYVKYIMSLTIKLRKRHLCDLGVLCGRKLQKTDTV